MNSARRQDGSPTTAFASPKSSTTLRAELRSVNITSRSFERSSSFAGAISGGSTTLRTADPTPMDSAESMDGVSITLRRAASGSGISRGRSVMK